ncbi:hypothetical protein GQ457_13G020760 [Hibiscus cannabinus]
MEKPSELSAAEFPKIPGSHGGRPPDLMLAPTESVVSGKDVQVLERHGSPIPSDVLPMAKRGRTGFASGCDSMEEGREVSDFDTNIGEVDASTNLKGPTGNPVLAMGPTLVQARHEDGQSKLSFRDSLLGNDGVRFTVQTISELDVEVTDEDVLLGGDNVLPEIRFSDKVHDAIDEKLAKSVIIRLLGKSIGYRALLNIIQSLWNPMGEVQLIDLDNDYFLVRFAKEEEYVHVLTGGPWVIYGSYLTVQSWSRNFSTSTEYPEKIMVWVRLPKLPYRYYTKSLFRYTANAIGKIFRIDYNTEYGKRGRFARLAVIIDLNRPLVSGIVIDGTRQDIEYEGLPAICFSCGKYGHSKDLCGKEDAGIKNPEVEDSQEVEDATCQVTNNTDVQLPVEICTMPSTMSHKGKETITTPFNGEGNSGSRSFRGGIASEHTNREMAMDLDANMNGLVDKEVGGLMLESVKEVASSERVVTLDITLNKENHIAVRIGDSSGGSKAQTKIASALKSDFKQGPKPKKRDDRGPANPSLAGQISTLVSELDKAKAAEAVNDVESRDGSVQWRANGVFDQPGNTLDWVDEFIRKFGFEFSYRVEASGFSEGIWLLWSASVSLDIVAISSQFLHARCLDKVTMKEFFITYVYASPCSTKRSRLWYQLKALEPEGEQPWILGGDFNAICTSNERQGGSQSRCGTSPTFRDFIFDTSLLDMGWYNIFDKSEVLHLQKLGSDHRPLLLVTGLGNDKRGNQPFCYIAAWNDHPDFNNLFSSTWKNDRSLHDNIAKFQGKSQKWSLDVFGHIEQRKNLLLSRLKGVEKALERGCNPYLIELEISLKCDLETVLEQEKSLWFQRARTKWIQMGDRNTAYFHASTLSRCRHNYINMLHLPDGSLSNDHTNLKGHAIDFFRTLLTSEARPSLIPSQPSAFYQFGNSTMQQVLADVSKEEVRAILFGMYPLKALGVDGIHAAFYQKNWAKVGDCVFNVVRKFFTTGNLEEWMNQTLLVLIPKPFLLNWVDQTQASFVPGRQITDNIIMAQEAIHSMANKKGQSAWMAIKVDIEKAYDRLEWDYIEETLHQEVDDLDKYLGVPLLHKRVTRATYAYILDKMRTRLSVTDEDVLLGGDNVLPEIRFSDKVHDAIDEKLAKSVIIRLLGKSIGYRALLNIIQSLWNPMGEVQLIDLDNDYFLVRFAKEEEYVHVLTGGPWVIYGSYLTVQSWSRNFSTSTEYPEKIMVWVRLPKLPYRYYTKSLFRYTANAIGKIFRIDYNTEDGKRGRFARLAVIIDLNRPLVSGIVIDGTRQDIEYEGLPAICFSCGKYGHSKDLCGKEDAGIKNPEVEDSQEVEDATCQVTNNTDVQLPVEICTMPSTMSYKGKETITTPFNGEGNSGSRSFRGGIASEHTNREMAMDLDANMNGLVDKEVGGLMLESVKEVASSERVVTLDITLNKENHIAVRIGDSSEANRIKERRGPKPKKRDDRGPANPSLAGRISTLVSELDKAKAAEAANDVESRDGSVQWRANGVFDHPGNTLDWVDEFIRKFGFEFSYRVEASGFSEGIWLLWSASVSLDIVAISSQFLHARCLDKVTMKEFFITCVYASPCSTKRSRLWYQLKALEPEGEQPWILGGDFNAICTSNERQGGSYWYNIFDKSEVLHLQKLGSDHRPLLLVTGLGNDKRGNQPFCYIAAWNDHPDFNNLFSSTWKNDRSLHDNIAKFQGKSQKWSLDVFGHIEQRKNLLLSRLKGVEKALERGCNSYLIELEISLKCDLETVLEQEKSLWFQRARTKWIQMGDRNTAYFHASTLSRCRRNYINMLHLPDGSLSNDHTNLKGHAIDFFRTLLTSEARPSLIPSQSSAFYQFGNSTMQQVLADVSKEEVRAILFGMYPLKALGVDGIHAAFYQKNWAKVGDCVFNVVRKFFTTGNLEEWMNQTLLVLIPKPFLLNWVDQTQASFVPGRQITDNIIMAQEAIHSMANKKGQSAWMAIKVDIEKAYDRLEWDYIEETLHQILRAKYGWNDALPIELPHTNASRLWRGLGDVWGANFKDYSQLDNRWLDESNTLASVTTVVANTGPVKVAEMVDENGGWNWRRIAQWLHPDVMEKFAVIKPANAGPDIP